MNAAAVASSHESIALSSRWSAPMREIAPGVVRGELRMRLSLRHAGPRDVLLRWQLLGRQGAPLVIVLGGISAHRHLCAHVIDTAQGWWPEQVRTDGALDPARYRLLTIDWLGADGSLDCPIDPDDQAQAIERLLEEQEFHQVRACVGASYGAMVGMHLAKRLGKRLGHLVVLSASARPHPFASAWRAVQRKIVRLGRNHDAARDGVVVARALAILSYRTPEEFEARFTDGVVLEEGIARASAERYLDVQGDRFANRFEAVAFERLSESIDLHTIDPSEIHVPTTVFAATSDRLVPIEDARRFSSSLPRLATYCEVDSLFGHDAFLKESAAVSGVLATALTEEEGAK
jgi:homoserine O-acetyltransferase